MELYFAVFALLPLALSSLFDKGRHRHTAGFGFLAALAPVIAKGIGSLISHKQNKSKEKQAQEQAKLDAAAADAQAKQQWEAQQNNPQAQAARYKNTLQLGRLAAGLGGMDKVPKSMAAYYNSMRSMPQYTGTSSYVAPAQKKGSGWDIAAGVTDALGYLDTSKLGKPKATLPAPTGFGTGSSFGNESAQIGAGLITGRATNPAVTSITRQPWDQTQLQYSTPGSRTPTVFSPTNYDPKTGRAF